MAGDTAVCRQAGISDAPVGWKAESALKSGLPTVNVEKLREGKTCRIHPASWPALLRKLVASEEGTM